MKRKDYNIIKSELRRLLREVDRSFVPNHVYDKDSTLYRSACNLRYVADVLCSSLVE